MDRFGFAAQQRGLQRTATTRRDAELAPQIDGLDTSTLKLSHKATANLSSCRRNTQTPISAIVGPTIAQ